MFCLFCNLLSSWFAQKRLFCYRTKKSSGKATAVSCYAECDALQFMCHQDILRKLHQVSTKYVCIILFIYFGGPSWSFSFVTKDKVYRAKNVSYFSLLRNPNNKTEQALLKQEWKLFIIFSLDGGVSLQKKGRVRICWTVTIPCDVSITPKSYFTKKRKKEKKNDEEI